MVDPERDEEPSLVETEQHKAYAYFVVSAMSALKRWFAKVREDCEYCEHPIKERVIHQDRAFCSQKCARSWEVLNIIKA